MLIPTVDTARTKFVVGALARAGHHALVIGAAGVGKTMTLASLLEGLPAGTAHATINFSAQTSSAGLQVRGRGGTRVAAASRPAFFPPSPQPSSPQSPSPLQNVELAQIRPKHRPGLRASWRSAPKAFTRPPAAAAWWSFWTTSTCRRAPSLASCRRWSCSSSGLTTGSGGRGD